MLSEFCAPADQILKTDPGIYNDAILFQDYQNSRNSIHPTYLNSSN
jgi:hypothetical protein